MVKIGIALGRAVVVAAAACAVATTAAAAGTTTASFAVSMTVEPSCHLDARPLRFQPPSGDGSRGEAEGAVAVACTPDTAYVVSLDDGMNATGGARQMANPAGEMLPYELYSDAARTRRWGTCAAQAVHGRAADGRPVTLPVYAKIAAVSPVAGKYSDVVTVTVGF